MEMDFEGWQWAQRTENISHLNATLQCFNASCHTKFSVDEWKDGLSMMVFQNKEFDKKHV